MTNYFRILLLVFGVFKLSAQIEVITTNSTDNLWQVSVIRNKVIVNGWYNYFEQSTDNCNTMAPLTIPSPSGYLNYIVRLNADTLYMLSNNFGAYNNKLYRSVNGGHTWVQKHDSSGLLLTHAVFFNDSSGVVMGVGHRFARTNDRGNTWRGGGTNPFMITDVAEAFGDSTIFAAGFGTGVGVFMISKDRGVTWTTTGGIGSTAIRDFFFFNKDTIIATASPGHWSFNMAKSFNGGASWTYGNVPIMSAWGTYFVNKNTGYVVGMDLSADGMDTTAVIAKTTDLGQSWKKLAIPIETQLREIQALNDSLLLISGTNGVLLRLNTKRAVFDEVVGIGENNINNIHLVVSPNPVKDQLNLEFTGSNIDDLKLSVSNTLGQAVLDYTILSTHTAINVSGLERGIYFLKIEGKNNIKTLKIVKE